MEKCPSTDSMEKFIEDTRSKLASDDDSDRAIKLVYDLFKSELIRTPAMFSAYCIFLGKCFRTRALQSVRDKDYSDALRELGYSDFCFGNSDDADVELAFNLACRGYIGTLLQKDEKTSISTMETAYQILKEKKASSYENMTLEFLAEGADKPRKKMYGRKLRSNRKLFKRNRPTTVPEEAPISNPEIEVEPGVDPDSDYVC